MFVSKKHDVQFRAFCIIVEVMKGVKVTLEMLSYTYITLTFAFMLTKIPKYMHAHKHALTVIQNVPVFMQ